MTATNREKEIYGSGEKIVRREGNCTVYRLANDSGDVVMTSYEVFPSIALVYDDVHTRQCPIGQAEVVAFWTFMFGGVQYVSRDGD